MFTETCHYTCYADVHLNDIILIKAKVIDIDGRNFSVIPHRSKEYKKPLHLDNSMWLDFSCALVDTTTPADSEHRPFKAGDLVRCIPCNGRPPKPIEDEEDDEIDWSCNDLDRERAIVQEDEENGRVSIKLCDCNAWYTVHHSNLTLITPAEERQRFEARDTGGHWQVVDTDDNEVVCNFSRSIPNAKQEAQRICRQLNTPNEKESA